MKQVNDYDYNLLENNDHCCGNRDDIFNVGSLSNKPEVIIIGILLS